MSEWLASGVSDMAAKLQGSSILAIAAQVRALAATGKTICNLTIGDFDPKHYPLPEVLLEGTYAALKAGHSNYPPANGILELRQAVQRFCAQRLGWTPPLDNVLIAGGARPVLYGAFRAIVNPGEKVVYGTPSWNNNHYAHLVGAIPVEIPVTVADNFFPRLDQIEPHIAEAAMIVINSPLNPSGTCIDAETLLGLCERIVAENFRRSAEGRRPLFLCYDQIYWTLTFGEQAHADPVGVMPEMADYTIYIDGISKCFAATGLRVGWTVAPKPVCDAMNRVLGHVGAWAPKAEQVATAQLLNDDAAVDQYLAFIRAAAESRLQLIHQRITALANQGYPLQALVPQGAIYLSAEFALRGWCDGDVELATPAAVRSWLLEAAGLAVVPFDAFGATHATDWYRLSVGACGIADLAAAFDRLEAALARLQQPK